jgi:hypothetical protein
MVGETVVMNATSMGLTGITNLSSQTGTIGSVLGAALLIGLIMGAFASAHSWNTRGWLFKLVAWLVKNVGVNFVYGTASITIVGSIYYIGNEIGKFAGDNPNLLGDALRYGLYAIMAIAAVAIIGYITKPIYRFAYGYATGNSSKAKSR